MTTELSYKNSAVFSSLHVLLTFVRFLVFFFFKLVSQFPKKVLLTVLPAYSFFPFFADIISYYLLLCFPALLEIIFSAWNAEKKESLLSLKLPKECITDLCYLTGPDLKAGPKSSSKSFWTIIPSAKQLLSTLKTTFIKSFALHLSSPP